MLEDLMNSPVAWAVLSLLSVFSTVFAIYTWLKGIERKQLSYTYSSTAIIRGGEKTNNAIKVTYNGIEVDNLTSTKVAIWNSGNKVLNKNDIVAQKELAISVNEGEKILAVEIVAQSDDTNEFVLTKTTDNSQGISFEYADVQEGAVLQVFHTGYSDDIVVDVKIKGGKPAQNISPNHPNALERIISKKVILFEGFTIAATAACGLGLATMWIPAVNEWIKLTSNMAKIESMGIVKKLFFSTAILISLISINVDGISRIKKEYNLSVPNKLRKYL